jgi:SPX domain protein involved in polyphosphate accumulation
MKFGQQFEFHKIPEWYCMYLNYDKLKKLIEDFKADESMKKLPGLYSFTEVNDNIQFYSFVIDR